MCCNKETNKTVIMCNIVFNVFLHFYKRTSQLIISKSFETCTLK